MASAIITRNLVTRSTHASKRDAKDKPNGVSGWPNSADKAFNIYAFQLVGEVQSFWVKLHKLITLSFDQITFQKFCIEFSKLEKAINNNNTYQQWKTSGSYFHQKIKIANYLQSQPMQYMPILCSLKILYNAENRHLKFTNFVYFRIWRGKVSSHFYFLTHI